MKRSKVFYLVLVPIFTALTAIGAFIKIPFWPVPFTMQFLFCCLSGVLLGARLGALSQLLYLIIGLAGIPIFTSGGGWSYIYNPTFGYIIGFVICSFVTGYIVEKIKFPSLMKYSIATIVGMLVLYLIGTPYLYFILTLYSHKAITVSRVIYIGFLAFLPIDIIMSIFSATVAIKIKPILKRLFLS